MRFSVLGVALIMASILVLAIFVTDYYRSTSYQSGSNLALVFLRSSDAAGLAQAMESENARLMTSFRNRGVSFMRCYAPSTWPPASMVSILTGLYPSEHGFHRAHVHLSEEAATLGEKLGRSGYRTCACIGNDSVLEAANAMQGFTFTNVTEPRETIFEFLEFYERLPDYRPFAAVVEVDLDAFGGPGLLEKVLDILYDGLGRERFFENGVLALMALDCQADLDPRMPVVMVGDPLKIGPGKCVLKPVSASDLHGTFEELAFGQGFDIRDAVRDGRAVVCETADDGKKLAWNELVEIPPVFFRTLWFDDCEEHYLTSPSGMAWVVDPEGRRTKLEGEEAERFRSRYELYLNSRLKVHDIAIPQTAGPLIDRHLLQSLGEVWDRPEFMGRPLHAVEHFRLGEAMRACGYPALAVAELNCALAMDQSFSLALFTLAEIYAEIDPKGAERYYREFLDKYGTLTENRERARSAARFLGIPSK